jgi:rhodanese-related sulfurtransferase
MKDLAKQAAVLAAAAVLLAVGLRAFSPHPLPWAGAWRDHIRSQARAAGLPVVETDSVRKFLGTGALVLDARAARAWRRGHLPGAVSLPWMKVDTEFRHVEPLLMTPDTPALVYCERDDCDEGLLLARHLRRRGYGNITLFAGGYAAWRKAGGPVEASPAP